MHTRRRLHNDPPFWDPCAPGLQTWLAGQPTPADQAHTLTNRLKWILECTMGAPKAFEYRRQELAELQRTKREAPYDAKEQATVVSDAEVTASFIASVRHAGVYEHAGGDQGGEGIVVRYLRLAQLAVRLHDTVGIHVSCPWSPLFASLCKQLP